MVSGLVTSPFDQDRILSGLASRILMASKSMGGRPTSTFGLMGIIKLIGSLRSRRSKVEGRRVPPDPTRPSSPLSFPSPCQADFRLSTFDFRLESMLGLDQL